MAATHEVIHIGDHKIWGEQADEITWRLTGKGLEHYSPHFDDVITLSGAVADGGHLHLPVKIYAFGDLRWITIGPLAWTAAAATTGLASAVGAIPIAHLPKSGGATANIQIVGHAYMSTVGTRNVLYTINGTDGHVDAYWCGNTALFGDFPNMAGPANMLPCSGVYSVA